MARAAVIPQSPPKRTTRTRTKGSTTTTSAKAAPKTTKARAPSSATEARKRGGRTTAAASRPADEDADESTDDEIGMFSERKTTTVARPKGRPTTKSTTTTASRGRKATLTTNAELGSDNDDELAQSDAPKKRAGRPRTKPATPAKTETVPKTRGRPKGSTATKSAKPVDPVKENTRLNAKGFTDIDFSSSQEAPKRVYIATNSTTARSNMLRGPAKKKKVTFQDPSETAEEDMSEPSPPPAAGRRRGTIGPGRQAGLASKPVRKPAATSAKGRKPATAKKEGPKPLSPKKATQVAKALSSYADSDGEDDELSGDKDQVKFVVNSPPKHGSENTGLSSPVKKINITGKFRKSLDENGEPLPGPRRSIDFNDTLLMSSPARRPPPSPFNFSMRETPKRGAFAPRDDPKSLSQPHLSPTHNSPLKLSPRKAHLETPKRGSVFLDSGKPLSQPNFTPGHNSPLKASPRKGLFGASFTSQAHAESTSTPLRHSVSFLQSPAKRIASPFKSSLFASRSPITEDVQVDTRGVEEPATPDVDESPLRMTEFQEVRDAESEDEQVDDDIPEGVDDNDATKEVDTKSPAAAEESDEDTLHEEFDREQTIEYEEEYTGNAAEDVTTHEEPNESDVPNDQQVEEPAHELVEATEEPMEESEEEFRDDAMEEPADELVESTEEPIKEPNNEPMEEPMEEYTEEMAEESVSDPTEHIDEPVEEPMEKLADESVEPPMEETEEPVEAGVTEPAEESSEPPIKELVTEPDAELVREPEAEQTHPTVEDEETGEMSNEHEAQENATEYAEDSPELDAEVSVPDNREDTVEMEDISVSLPKDSSPSNRSETREIIVEEEPSAEYDQGGVEQPEHEAEERTETTDPATETAPGPANTGLRSSLVEGLEDVFVERAAPPEPVNVDRDGSETEDDPDMLEAADEENAADAFDDFDDVDDEYTFDDTDPTLVGFEPTERIPPNLVPIQPYEVEEAEDPFSPSRQAQNASKRVLSPVRILESPVRRSPIRRSARNAPTPAAAMDNGTQNNADLSDPFVEHTRATPRRRSTRGLLFDNAPRFTPLAQQFRQWKSNSPEKAQATRPRRGIFSLGGRRRSSNVTSTSEVSYPDVSRQAEASSSKPQTSQQEREDVDVREVAGTEEQEPEENAEPAHEETPMPVSPAAQEQSEDVDVPEHDDEDQEQEAEPIAEEPNQPSSAELPTPQEDLNDVDMSLPEEQDQDPEPVDEEPSPEQVSLPNSPILEEDSNDADMPAIHEDEPSQPIGDMPSQMEALLAEPDTLQETDKSTDIPEIYEDEDSGSQQAGNTETFEEPLEQSAEVVESSQEAVADASEDKENMYAVPSVPYNLASESQPDKERELGDIPILAPSTPMKNRIPEMQTVHTISKVPLKPEGQISPLKMSRKRGLSLSASSPGRSSRPRMSAIAPVARNAPQLSPRKSPRLQRTASRQSLGQSHTPDTARKPIEAQRPAPPKRPSYSPSPKKKTKTPRTSINAPKLALQGSVVYVDVHTTEGEDASGIFIELLQQMGARCVKNWSWNPRASVSPEEGTEPKEGKVGITHVVYKDGGVRTLEKVRHARGLVKCVGVGWVLDCERENKWLDEAHYEVDLSIIPRGGAKRRKSMEPRALSNVNGTLVKTDAASASANRRRSSLAPPKESIPRDATPSSRDEPSTPDATPKIGAGHTEADQQYCHTPKTPGYTLDMDAIGMSPATPFYLSQRTKLVQQTCPPKQTRQGLFTTPAAAREPNQKLRAKLEAARRKSMAYKPRVGSPLVE
ncbi:uncharacterized protein AKAW2_51376S [Aspergillus luchuensis]|uniref:BRCT domain-containing protein n=1 Tax=Aspergillus kawachii TaxID=1069201 RepID=A0A146FJ54_ASPKA|nr:uncharacterized protein AKAW2_51376S [Aspergillus luchuensis]BCS01035.1 hypothetical protein AKAW2_51376S [Aspergillus luchuensis]BCS12790.1 hypothetical protein ALUC_50836S [Aspergillus luchuensis]GAA82818.1 hypothetical protein AKAW_00933 [Aspergillus luchuensis IFO 4308]GAT25777.1 hypothetical protein RIB2604_02003540 [Aspergillus luchuensis]